MTGTELACRYDRESMGVRAPASAVYLTAGSWPAGAQLAEARFGVALAAAEWAVRLPPETVVPWARNGKRFRTRQSAAEPGMHQLSPLPPLARHITRTMPWGTLITGCLAGTAVRYVVAHVADGSRRPFSQAAIRLAFLPAVAALAFVLRAWFRPVSQATPVAGWVGSGRPSSPGGACSPWPPLASIAPAMPTSAGPSPSPSLWPLSRSPGTCPSPARS